MRPRRRVCDLSGWHKGAFMQRAEDISQSRRIAALVFLLIGYFFYAWSWNTVDILRPYIKDDLGLTLTQSGSLYTMQAIGAIIGAVVCSALCFWLMHWSEKRF